MRALFFYDCDVFVPWSGNPTSCTAPNRSAYGARLISGQMRAPPHLRLSLLASDFCSVKRGRAFCTCQLADACRKSNQRKP